MVVIIVIIIVIPIALPKADSSLLAVELDGPCGFALTSATRLDSQYNGARHSWSAPSPAKEYVPMSDSVLNMQTSEICLCPQRWSWYKDNKRFTTVTPNASILI